MAQLLRATARPGPAHACNSEVELDLPATPRRRPYLALADANQLQQVLVNLALNARDAMPASRQPASRSSSACGTSVLPGELPAFPQNVPPGDYVVLEVEDRGSGMTPDVLSQALDPFFTTKEVGQGTGLGLPVVFGIIHGHQGCLTIDSQPGRGTTRPHLPAAAGRATARSGRGGPSATRCSNPRTPRAAASWSWTTSRPCCDVVRRFLEIAGHRVTAGVERPGGADLLAGDPSIELAILDLMIPKEEGVANFRQIRQLRPQLPVLLCTGLVQSEQASELLRQGVAALLRKPFRMNELWYAVNRCLDAAGPAHPGRA